MNKISNLLKLILVLIALFSSNCCDDKTEDYRDSFIADYQCSYALKTLTVYRDSKETFIDTIYFSRDTVISIAKSNIKNEISFLDWEIVVNKNGEIDSIYCNTNECMECETFSLDLGVNKLTFETSCGGKTTWYNYKLEGIKL